MQPPLKSIPERSPTVRATPVGRRGWNTGSARRCDVCSPHSRRSGWVASVDWAGWVAFVGWAGWAAWVGPGGVTIQEGDLLLTLSGGGGTRRRVRFFKNWAKTRSSVSQGGRMGRASCGVPPPREFLLYTTAAHLCDQNVAFLNRTTPSTLPLPLLLLPLLVCQFPDGGHWKRTLFFCCPIFKKWNAKELNAIVSPLVFSKKTESKPKMSREGSK